MLSALCARESGDVEITAAEAIGEPEAAYRCLACGQAVFPILHEGEAVRASFSHAADADPCRRSPKRPDRRKTFRTGGRRAGD